MIEVKNLSKTYINSDGKHLALSKINFKLGNSGMVFLKGKSGQGKSTLLNILSALEMYDANSEVLYNGRELKAMSQAERDDYRSYDCGVVFEGGNLVPELSVIENIKLANDLKGNDVSEKELVDVLKTIKLTGYENRKITELSSGEKQRVSLGRVLIAKPKILFIDEPTEHLDSENSELFWEMVKKQSKNILIVAITHDKDVVDKYADRVLEIKAGKIISDTYISSDLEKEDEKIFKEQTTLPVSENTKKRHFPKFSSLFKLGTKILKFNKFKVVSMVILMTLTLVAFSFSYLLSIYNPSFVMAKSAFMQNLDYVTFEKENSSEISNEDIKNLYENIDQSTFYKIFVGDSFVKLGKTENESASISGFMSLTQSLNENKNVLGQNIVIGEYPSVTSKTNKIAISDYMASKFSYYGINVRTASNPDVFKFYQNKDYSELINNEIKIGNTYYSVCAIYDTDFEKFVDLNTFTVFSNIDKELYNYNVKNIYSMIHTTESCVQGIVGNIQSILNVNMFLSTDNGFDFLRTVNATCFSNATNYNILGAKTTLSKGEVLLPLELFNEIFNSNITILSTDEDIQNVMDTSIIKIGTKYNTFDSYNIIGVVDKDYIVFADNNSDISGCFGEVVQANVYPTMKIASKFNSEKDLEQAISSSEALGFKYNSMYSSNIEEVSEFIVILKTIIIVATVFIALFCMYFMFTFFATIITNNKRTIGIYRCLGTKFIAIASIYMVTCLLLMLISLSISMLISFIGIKLINIAVAGAFALPISIFNIQFSMFAWMFVLACSMAIIGNLIPTLIYCQKTPADVIKK